MPLLRHPESALVGRSYGWSFLVHAGALAAWLAWQAWPLNDYERAENSGKQGIVVLEASFQAPTEVSPAAVVVQIADPVEAADTASHDVMSQARPLEQQRLSQSDAAKADPASAIQVADVRSEAPPTETAATRRTTTSADQPPMPASQPVEVAARTRTTTTLQPVATLAAIPQTPGVRSETTVSWALNPPPAYPPLALARGWNGTALLRVWINSEGAIERVEVERSSGFEILDRAAVTAVQQWRAKPAMRFGQAIPSVELQAIIFLPRRY